MLSYTKRLRLLGYEVALLAPDTGALPLGPTGGLPRPRYFTPGRYSEGVTVVEPQKSTQIFWVYLYAE